MKLTDHDHATLSRAADLRKRFDAGIFPSTVGDRSHFKKLERWGLLEFDMWGRDLDGEVERDVEIYKLTEAGNDVLEHAPICLKMRDLTAPCDCSAFERKYGDAT